jgi:natural resistance-associated macrophage protein
MVSAAYVDPGNLESDLQAGGYVGYQLLWVLGLATALGLALQLLAARLGVVTGLGLAEHCRAHYRRRVSVLLWLLTELAIIGADVQEIIGSAYAWEILLGVPMWAGCLITGLDTLLILALQLCGRGGLGHFESFVLAMVATMAVAFLWNTLAAGPAAAEVAEAFVLPRCPGYAVVQAVSLVGAVIMPQNVFLHSALVADRPASRAAAGPPEGARDVGLANRYNAIESALALGVPKQGATDRGFRGLT